MWFGSLPGHQRLELMDPEKVKVQGNSYYKQGNAHLAVRCYTRAIGASSEKNDLLCSSSSSSCFIYVVLSSGQNPVYFFNRSAAYNKLKQSDNAIADVRKATQLSPKSVKVGVPALIF